MQHKNTFQNKNVHVFLLYLKNLSIIICLEYFTTKTFYCIHLRSQANFASKGIICPFWSSLRNSITCQPILPESSSNPQKNQWVFWFVMNK